MSKNENQSNYIYAWFLCHAFDLPGRKIILIIYDTEVVYESIKFFDFGRKSCPRCSTYRAGSWFQKCMFAIGVNRYYKSKDNNDMSEVSFSDVFASFGSRHVNLNCCRFNRLRLPFSKTDPFSAYVIFTFLL